MVQCCIFLNAIKPKSAHWHLNTALLGDKWFLKNVLKRFGMFCKNYKELFWNTTAMVGFWENPDKTIVNNTLRTSLER